MPNSSSPSVPKTLGQVKDVPVYSALQVVEKLQSKRNAAPNQPYPAMYSSYFGAIVLDPAMMVLPMDDHMVHRGHGVFDTAVLLDGYLYELDTHLERFLLSASRAKVSSPFPKEILKSILIQMTAASKCRKGALRYWLSAGPGDFNLSPSGCPEPAFYAVVIADNFSQRKQGVKVVTAATPMKPPLFATMKNVNYLPNVFAIMEAEEKGAFSSVWVDENGHIAEGPNVNVAFISKKGELVLPTFDKILAGCTAKRLLAVAPKLIERRILKSVETRNITLEEAKNSAEMMYVGSGLPLMPIIEWDGKPVGNSKVGELTMALSDLIWDDMTTGPERIRVPYEDSAPQHSKL